MLRYNLRNTLYIVPTVINKKSQKTAKQTFSQNQNAKIIIGMSILYTWLVYIVNMAKLIECLYRYKCCCYRYICCCFFF